LIRAYSIVNKEAGYAVPQLPTTESCKSKEKIFGLDPSSPDKFKLLNGEKSLHLEG